MSKTIDERVVSMKFENGQFESGVKQSLSTIEKLKQALNFKDSSTGLEKTGVAVTKASSELGSFGNSVETVKARFSALDVVAVTALANITNAAVNAGKNVVKALAIEPISTGLQEYETKINAVQTIMANVSAKGKTISDVTEVLDELNRYADLTIYNFTEMTRNIGTFTAAGVDLNVAVDAIQGIANLAATSGSTSQQASTAMYQLSQAIAAGTVKLQDWNSVVNAGMGGETFQNGLKQTAREMGIAVDQIIEDSGSFRESLSEGWLSAEVLNTTLKKFTVDGAKEYAAAMEASGKYTAEQSAEVIKQAQVMEDAATKIKTFTQLWDVLKESAQSGWTTTFELIIGDFEEAKESLSALGDILTGAINGLSDSRNNLLSAALGGSGSASTWSQLSAQVEKAGIDIDEFKNKLIEVGKQHGVITDEMVANAGSFEASLKDGWLDTSIFKEVLSSYSDAGTAVSNSTEDMTAKLEKFQKVVDEVWSGEWGNAPERYQKLADAGYDYAKVQELVNKTMDGHRLTIADLGESEMKAIGFTEDQIAVMKDLQAQCDDTGSSVSELITQLSVPSGRELLWESLFNVITAVSKALSAVRDGYREVFPAITAKQIYDAIDAFHSFTEWLILSDEQCSNLKTTFKGLFSIARLLATSIKTGITLAFKGISTVLGGVNIDVLKYTSAIGSAATAMADFVSSADFMSDASTHIKAGVDAIISVISELTAKFISLESVQNVIQTLTDKLGSKFEILKNVLGDVGKYIEEFIEKVKSMDFADGFNLDSLTSILETFKETVLDQVVDIQGAFDNLVINIKGIPSDIKTGATKLHSGLSFLLDKLNLFVDALQDHIRPNINLGEILAVGLGGSSIYFIKQLGSLLEKLKGPMDALEGMFTNFGKIGTSVSGYFTALTKQVKVDSIEAIAKSLLMLAGALVAIAAIPSDKLAVSVGILVGLGAGLTALAYAMSKMGEMGSTTDMLKMAGSLAIMAGGFSLMANALTGISDVAEGGHLVSSLVSLAAIAAGLVGVMKILNKGGLVGGAASIKELLPSLMAMVAVASTIKLMISALESVADISVDKLIPSILGLVSVAAAMRIAMAAIGRVKITQSAALVSTALALVAFIKALECITVVDLRSLLAAIPQFVAVMGLFSTLMMATQMAGKYAVRGAASMVLISAALILISQAMKSLADLGDADLDGAVDAMSKVMVVVALVIASTKLAGKYSLRAGVAIVAMCSGLMMLAGAMAVLSQLDPAGVDTATNALVKLEAMFAVVVAASKFATGTKLTVIALVTSISILAAAVAALAMIDPSSVKNATLCISAILGMFALVVAASQFAHDCAGTMIAISLVLAELAGIFYVIAQMDAPNALDNCAALSLVTAALATLVASTALIKPMTKQSFGAMQALLVVITELALVLKVIEALDVDVKGSQVAALAEVAAIFAALTTVLGVVGSWKAFSVAGVSSAVISMIEVIGLLGGAMAAVGALSNILAKFDVSLGDQVSAGLDVLNRVATGIGEFFGNIVGGFTSAATSGLIEAGENISAFMSTVGAIDAGAIDNFKSVIEALGSMYKTQSLASFSEFLGGTDLAGMGDDLVVLGEDLNAFAESVKDIKASDIAGAAQLMTSLAELQEVIPTIGGIASVITGSKDLGAFGATLVPFVEGLSYVAELVGSSAIPPVAIANFELIISAAKQLAGLSEHIAPIGGLASALSGSTDLASFGSTLPAFCDGLMYVMEMVSGYTIPPSAAINFEAIIAAAKQLAGLSEHIEPIGGLISGLTGAKDLGSFGATLGPFCAGMGEVATVLSQYSFDSLKTTGKITAIVNAASEFAGLQSSLNNMGGIVDSFTGSSDLDKFGEVLSEFINSMVRVCNTVNEADIPADVSTKINAIVSAATQLATLQNSLTPEQTFLNKQLNGDASLNGFGGQIEVFIRHVAEAFASLNDVEINTDGIAKVVTACKQLQELQTAQNGVTDVNTNGLQQLAMGIKSIGTSLSGLDAGSLGQTAAGLKQLATVATDIAALDFGGLDQFATKLQDIAATSVDGFVDTISNSQGRVRNAVAQMTNGLADGVTNSKSAVTAATQELVDSLPQVISASSSNLQTAAFELGTAIADGIKQGSTDAESAIDTVMTSCQNAVRSANAGFQSAGAYAAAGMADGIKSKKGSVVAAAKELAAAAEAAARVQLDINSPSRVFSKIGGYVCAGLANGIRDNTKDVTKQSTIAAKAIVTAFQTELKINSPSKVTRDEVGKYIVDGIAEGIEKNMSAEEAAAKKAENICNAFKEEIEHFDLRATTQSLEYQLWQALNPNASESVASAKSIEDMQKRLALQAEKTTLYKGEYETMLKTLGADADETREAYNEYIQAMIDLVGIGQELADVQADSLDVNREAFKAANELYSQVHDSMVKLGYTEEAIWNYCKEKFGYDDSVSLIASSLQTTKTALDYANDALDKSSGTVAKYAEATKNNAEYIYATGEQIKSAVVSVDETLKSADGATTKAEPFDTTVTNLEQLAVALNNVAKSADGAKVAAEVSNALSLMPEDLENAAETTVDSFLEALNKLLDACEKNDMLDPVITPVVDLTDAYAKFEQLNRMFNSIGGTAAGTTTGTISNSVKNTRGAATSVDNTGRTVKNASYGLTKPTTSVMITQNNYSPKALNRSDIYRDTKNLISTAKTASS